ncbi:hypothetical protein FISHEDRAFT_57292 [Fistulina hepatica ATCC 64428]|uniref:Uncharacterized protein n=1 Tax=Fistulina hepatica ATCC 64428 TaxID=1128425 RepID=A0A0D7AGN0_9AGAR|nr:hypothetical protein FISHEDRAFT_57292 [Fistulina hepatica ATCC 64428]
MSAASVTSVAAAAPSACAHPPASCVDVMAPRAAQAENNNPVKLTPASFKEVRALEHNRNKFRKAQDYQRTASRRSQSWASRIYGLRKSSSGASAGVSRKNKLFVEVSDDSDVLNADLDVRSDWEASVPSSPRASFASSPLPPTSMEVKLADLVATARMRKSKDHDFEMIPHIRSVIALDDNFTNDLLPEESWEHISSSLDEPPRSCTSLSYAAVVAMKSISLLFPSPTVGSHIGHIPGLVLPRL